MKIPFILLIVFITTSLSAVASDREALSYFKIAQTYYDDGRYLAAKHWLEKALAERGYDGQLTLKADVRADASESINAEQTSHDYYPVELMARVQVALDQNADAPSTPDVRREKYKQPPDLSISYTLTGDGRLIAGQTLRVLITVENTGGSVAEDVRLVIDAPSQFRMSGDTAFGYIAPGKSKTQVFDLTAPRIRMAGTVSFGLKVDEVDGFGSFPLEMPLPVEGYKAPDLEVLRESLEMVGKRRLRLNYTVYNRGQGAAYDLLARLEMPDEGGMLLDRERDKIIALGELGAGQSRDISIDLYLNNGFVPGEPLPLTVQLLERDPNNSLTFPLAVRVPVMANSGEKQALVRPRSVSSSSAIANVDFDIPKGSLTRDYGIAVVIGNQDYPDTVSDVLYARNDARAVADYAEAALGFPRQRVDRKLNMTSKQFNRLFGTAKNGFRGLLYKRVQNAKAYTENPSVLIYYSGHGAPSLHENGSAYFVPTDVDNLSHIETEGYSIADFYASVQQLPTNDVTVIIDACFSGTSGDGTSLFSDISPALLKNVSAQLSGGGLQNAVVFTSAAKDEVSNWYRAGNHGLFTYHLLSGLRGQADHNQDLQISLGELEQFVIFNVVDHVAVNELASQTPKLSGDKTKIIVAFGQAK